MPSSAVDKTSSHSMSLWPLHVLLYSRLLTLIVVVVAVCILVYPPMPVLTLLADSAQYQAMSRSMLDGTFLQAVDVTQVPHLATVMRPPLFPLLLTLVNILPGYSPSSTLVVLHLSLAIVALGVTPFVLRRVAPPVFTALATGVALYSGKQVLWGEMSEWLAMCCLLGANVSYLLWCHDRRPSSACATSLFVALTVLTRTALLPWLTLIPLLVVQAPRESRRRTCFLALVGLLPLVLWGWIQLHRLGTFSLGAYESLNILATARSFGEVPIETTDSTETQLVLTRLNQRGVTVSDKALLSANVHQWDGELYAAFHHNFDEVCAAVQALSSKHQLPMMGVVGRSFSLNSHRYAAFLLGGIETFLSKCGPLLGVCLTIGTWLLLRSPRNRALGEACITVSLISALYVTSILLTILWLPRYFVPVQGSLLFLSVLSLFSLFSLVLGFRRGV